MMAQPFSGSRPARVPVSERFAVVAGAWDGSPEFAATPNRWALTIAGRSTVGATGGRSATSVTSSSPPEPSARQTRAASCAAIRIANTTVAIEGATVASPWAPPAGRRKGATIRSTSCMRCLVRGAGKPRHDTGCRRAATRQKGRENEVTTGTCATLLKLGLQRCRHLANAGPRHLCHRLLTPINEAEGEGRERRVAGDKERD